jgi:hypothetical protein
VQFSIFESVTEGAAQNSMHVADPSAVKLDYPKNHGEFDDFQILENILRTVDPGSYAIARSAYKTERLWNEKCDELKKQRSRSLDDTETLSPPAN